jgi:ATP-dependent Clp protease ATP-binding subunit ClpA
MFERFHQNARQVIIAAQEEARALGHNRIGTVHLLLGLVKDEDGTGGGALREHGLRPGDLRERVRHVTWADHTVGAIDGQALASIGIDLDEVRRTVEASFGEGALDIGRKTKGHIPFTPQAKKCLELSLRSATALKQRHICSGHILLGVLRATGDDNLALQVLREAKVDLDALRTTTTTLLQADAA